MKKRLCSCSSFSTMSVLLILIPLIHSSTTAAGGAPNPMMNITEPLSMSSMSMSMEESAGGDEVLLMMDSEINRMLASGAGNVYKTIKSTNAACPQGGGNRYSCISDRIRNHGHCPLYKRDCKH